MKPVYLFVLLAVSIAATAQKKKLVVPKTRVEYSLDTIMQRLDNMHQTLNNINNFQNKSFDTNRVKRELSTFNGTLAVIRSAMTGYNLPEYKQLLLYEYMLNYMNGKLSDWRATLFQYNTDLVSMTSETAAFAKDSLLRNLVRDSLYRAMYTSELQELLQKWDTARKTTAANLASINALQSAITPPYFLTTDLLDDVARMKTTITSRLFQKEYPYLWERGRSDAGSTGDLAARSARTERELMGFFLQLNWGYYIYALLIGLSFGFWVWNNFRKMGELPGDVTLHYIHRVPVLASLAVMLNILPFFDLDAPTVFTQLGQFILMIVVSVLFWMTWPRKYFLYWGLLLFLYVCYGVTGPLLVAKWDARLWLLLLNACSMVVAYVCLRKIVHLFPYPRTVRIVWWLCLGLNGLSILCNVFGRLSLAKIFSSASMFGLIQVIVLTVFIDTVLEAFTLQTAVSRRDERRKGLAPLFERMQRGVERFLLALAFITWLVAFAINLNVYDAVYAAVARVWNHVVHLGSISFKLGNVLLFIGIVYCANVLQKYIGYLYGSADEPGTPQPGKKGSQLVMVRLILIIAGFLLAIAASGLPIDRITIVLGALGVGIGLGLQTIVNNLVSGIILIFERPFQLGDYIELNGKKGMVRDIGIRASRMVTEAGNEIIMPNGDLLAGEVINWTVRNNQVRLEMPITVEAGPSFESVVRGVEEALSGHPDLLSDKPNVLLNTSTDKTLSITVLVWVSNVAQLQTIKSEVLDLLYQKFREKGIKPV